jgi:hypothetical protein
MLCRLLFCVVNDDDMDCEVLPCGSGSILAQEAKTKMVGTEKY